MKTATVSAAIAALICLSFGSAAFGQTIVFNKTFQCGAEHIAVQSCMNDSDDSYCMVMYPDRPLHNGFEVQQSQKRGDVIKMIQGCMGAGGTLASTGHPAPAPARSPAAKPNTSPPPDPSVAKAHAAGVDTTAIGLRIGETFSLPQCQQDVVATVGAILGMNAAPPPQKYPCLSAITNQNGASFNATVYFSQDQCPSWMTNNPCAASAMVRNGLLLGVYMFTTGQTGDAQASAEPKSKYGKPTQQQTVTFKNLYNYSAQFQQLNWSLPGLFVEYDPFLTDISQGEVQIETESGHQIRIAATPSQTIPEHKL